jgi:plasmid maintenance system antidote protein VapI
MRGSKVTELGKFIKKRLIDLGLSHKMLANQLGMKQQYLSQILTGEKPTGKYTGRLAKVLGTTEEEVKRLAALDKVS